MTGAGSATAAYTLESEFGAGPATDPTWIQPGIDVTINDLTVEQALERSRHPDTPLPAVRVRVTSRVGSVSSSL